MDTLRKGISWFNEIPLKVFIVLSMIGTFYFYGGNSLVLFKLPPKIEPIGFIVYLFSLGIVAVSLFTGIWNKISFQFTRLNIKKEYRRAISNLDSRERSVLREFYLHGSNTLAFPFAEPLIQGLVDKSVLINASSIDGGYVISGITTTYKINHYMKTIIDTGKDLGLPSNPTSEQIDFAMNNRPHWLQA